MARDPFASDVTGHDILPEAEHREAERNLILEQVQVRQQRAAEVQQQVDQQRLIFEARTGVNESANLAMRQNVGNAIAFHLGQYYEPLRWSESLVGKLTDQYFELFGNDPAALTALQEDVNAMAALTDADIVRAVTNGEDLSQFGDIWDSIAEVAWEVGARDEAVEIINRQSDTVKGVYQSLAESQAVDVARRADGSLDMDPDTVGFLFAQSAGPGPLYREQAAGLMQSFEGGGAWSYERDSNILAVTLGTDDNQRTVALRPRAGFNPADEIDVLAEVVYAHHHGELEGSLDPQEGRTGLDDILAIAESVGEYVDGHPELGESLDQIWDASTRFQLWNLIDQVQGDGTDLFGNPIGPIERAQFQIDAEKKQLAEQGVTAGPVLGVINLPTEALIATFAADIITDARNKGVDVTNQEALAQAADIITDPAVRESLTEEWWKLTQDELIADIEEELEGTTAFKRAVETGLGNTLELMQWWDSIAQQIGIRFFETIAAGVAVSPLGEGGVNLEEGFDHFTNIVTGTGDRTASEYFDLDGTAADMADLAAGVGFDPLNFLFVGAKGATGLFHKSLTDPRFASWYVRAGGVRSVTRPIANTTGRKALTNAMYLAGQGMSDDGIRAIVALARSTDSTIDDVNKVILSELPNTDGVGWFIGSGPNRAIRHKTIDGVGRAFESLGAGKISPEFQGQIFDLASTMGRQRTFDLGEHMALSNMADLTMMLYPREPDTALEWFLRAVDEVPGGASRQARVGAKTVTKQKASAKSHALNKHRNALRESFDLRGAQQNRDHMAASMRLVDDLPVDEAGKARVTTSLKRTIRNLDDEIARAEQKFGQYAASQREANRANAQALRFEGDMSTMPSRVGMSNVLYRMFDDLAKSLNDEFLDFADDFTKAGEDVIPVVKDSAGRPKLNPLTDPDEAIPLRDWSAITGSKKGVLEFIEEVKVAQGLGTDDALTRQLEAVGAFDKLQRAILPASPYEIMLFRNIRTNSALYRAWTQHSLTRGVSKVTSGLKLLFGLNLLLNPITAAKVTLDETARFFAQTGLLGKTVKSTLAGLPGAGSKPARLALVGSSSATRAVTQTIGDIAPIFRKIPGWRSLENARGTWVSNPWALQYMRSHEGFTGAQAWQWITPKTAGVSSQQYLQMAERWVNGTLLQDPVFRAYARFLPDATEIRPGEFAMPQAFVDWWNVGDGVTPPGSAWAKSQEFAMRVADGNFRTIPVDAQFAWDTIHRSFRTWVDNMTDGNGQLVRTLLESAGGRGVKRLDIIDHAHLFRSITQVPGLGPESGGPISRAVGAAFNGFFGNPSARRAGVFFEHFYDEAYGIYRTANTNKNTLITKEMLMDRFGVPESDAAAWLLQGSDNPSVRQLMSEAGAITERQMEGHAARYAAQRADDLMYRFTATSLAGQGLEAGLIFPFARAQMDFLGWWMDHLTRPMQLRGGLRAVLPEGVTQAVESVPINLRALGKYAHLNATLNNENQTPLDEAINQLTFFPFRWDSEFFMDVTPQLGPVPSWMVNVLSENGLLSEDVMDAMTTFQPAMEFLDSTEGFLDGLFPNSRRSLRDLLSSTMLGAATLAGESGPEGTEGMLYQMYEWLSENQQPAATNDFVGHEAALFLRDNVFNLDGLDAPGTAEWEAAVTELVRNATFDANQKEWTQDMKDRLDPFSSYDGEYRALVAWERMLDDPAAFDLLRHYELLSGSDLYEVGPDNRPRVLDLFEKWQGGQATTDDKRALADALVGMFFDAGDVPVNDLIPDFSVRDLLILQYPELAVNLINKSQCSGKSISGEAHSAFHNAHCNPQTGRLQNVPPGPAGADILNEARREGWVVHRPAISNDPGNPGWIQDAHEAAHGSAKRALDAVWYRYTGKEWRGELAKEDAGKTFQIDTFTKTLLEPLGFDIEVGQSVTSDELFGMVQTTRERYDVSLGAPSNLLNAGPVKQQLERSPFGHEVLVALKEVEDRFRKAGVDRYDDWPEEVRAWFRDHFNTAIETGLISLDDYQAHVAPLFGDIDFQPSVPSFGEIQAGLAVTPDQLRDGTVEVLDGDTLSLMTPEGATRVRIIGINAPEATQDGYTDATQNLINLLLGADSVTLAVYKPELFGVTQLTAPGEERLLMWLFVDGVPIYDESVFTSDNPRGAGVGGTVLDLEAILEAGR